MAKTLLPSTTALTRRGMYLVKQSDKKKKKKQRNWVTPEYKRRRTPTPAPPVPKPPILAQIVRRHCGLCNQLLDGDRFHKSDFKNLTGNGACLSCVNSGAKFKGLMPHVARKNGSAEIGFQLEHLEEPLSSPTSPDAGFVVARGMYTYGHRKYRPCVAKWYASGHTDDKTAFDHHFKRINKVWQIMAFWNQQRLLTDRLRLKFLYPDIFRFITKGMPWENRVVWVERYLPYYEKYNSNTGYVGNINDPWPRVMQALSHFTYHATDGKLMLCDLAGSWDLKTACIADPVILSHDGAWGEKDLGPEGMENFFHHHRCNEFCRPDMWMQPEKPRGFFVPQKETATKSTVQRIDPPLEGRTPERLPEPLPDPELEPDHPEPATNSFFSDEDLKRNPLLFYTRRAPKPNQDNRPTPWKSGEW
jgi:hypothetical protein